MDFDTQAKQAISEQSEAFYKRFEKEEAAAVEGHSEESESER